MQRSLILWLVAVAGVIALPISKMDLDPQAAVEGKLEVQVSSWFQIVSSVQKTVIMLIDGIL